MKIVTQNIKSRKFILAKIVIKNIYQDLFYLQKKIYLASRECNLSLIHSLQKLLVSSSSINILANHLATKRCKKVLSGVGEHKNSKLLRYQVNKLISNWCLEAEWKHRLANKFGCVYNNTSIYYTHCQVIPSNSQSIKNTDVKYVARRLQTIKWLKTNIEKLYCKHMLNSTMKWVPDSGLYDYIDGDPLTCLLDSVLQNDLYWLYYQQSFQCNTAMKSLRTTSQFKTFVNKHDKLYIDDKSIVYKFMYNTSLLKNCNYPSVSLNIRKNTVSSKLIKERLLIYLKHLLYHKDQSGRLRINHHKTFDFVFRIFFDRASVWKQTYGYLFTRKCLLNVNNLVNTTLRRWLAKRFSKHTRCSRLNKYQIKLL
uniref:Uncharacterized protein n=1 Tax=Nemalion sp. H.1444 TaxID=1907586 RepID=A0A1G4NW77_9FLOR|nr:Hypothetical protein ORF_3 [Nemalion sp. H.1444]